jgi:RNA polymerase sigma-70 factor (ECF subfamily)
MTLNTRQSNSNADRWRVLNELSDELLVFRLLEGEQDALTVLFDCYHKLVFSVAVRIVDDSEEAEEVVQTVFLDFFRGLASFDPKN